MMAIFIIAILIISILHFIYDGIILPGIRQHNRNKLFALRDRLRWEMIQGIQPEDIEAFNLIHDAVNIFTNRLPMLTISVQKAFKEDLEHNEKLRDIIQKRRKILNSCSNENIKNIALEMNGVLENTYIANAGGWFIYLIPIAIIVSTLKSLAEISSELTMAPPQEVHRIIPSTSPSSNVCC